MKKIIFVFVTIITMMLCIASPLFIKPINSYAVNSLNNTPVECLQDFSRVSPNAQQSDFKTVNDMISLSCSNSDDNFFYFKYHCNDSPFNVRMTIGISFYTGNVTLENGIINITNAKNVSGNNAKLIQWVNGSRYDFNFSSCTINLVNPAITTNSTTIQEFNYSNNSNIKYIWDIYSNISDFTNSNSLNVLVDFSPDLIGNVDRQISAIDGTKSMRKDLAMQVVNQSNFPIQYDMRIYKVNQSSSRDWSLNPETFATQFDSDSVSYDDDPVFIYYKNEWVYTTNYDSESTFWDLEPVKENKGASWHYLAANSQDIVTFNFTQINLDENVDYYVEVRAVRNDYGCSSEKIVYSASDNPAENEYKQIQGDDIETVYHEQFKMINYSDVVYNPNEESNGVLPYNGKNGIVSRNTYQYGRNARDNGNGNIDYTARNLYTDQNSWYNQQYHRVVSNHTSISSSGSVPSNITNLFDSFMKFVSYVFLRFPANMQTIYVYGFVSVVVLGIVLKVIK